MEFEAQVEREESGDETRVFEFGDFGFAVKR